MQRSKLSRGLLLSLILISTSCFTPTGTDQGTPKQSPEPSETASPVPATSSEKDADEPVLDGLPFDLNFGKLQIGGRISDAKTNDIINQKINIEISGADKDKLEKNQLSLESGLFEFGLKSGIKPSRENPLRLTVIAHSEGYFSSSKALILNTDKINDFEIKLVNKKDTPEGVVANTNTNAKLDNNGALTENIKISSTEKETNTVSEINIPANTIMRDKNGNKLSGDLKIDVAYYNNINQNSLDAFPGGLGNASVTGQDSQMTSGYFETGGFVSVDIEDKNGNQVKSFDKPVNISMQISKDTVNPQTGQKVKDGETIDIWSNDVNTGEWKWEAKATLKAADNGNFNVNYQVNHLSYWNLDWHYSEVCKPQIIFNWDQQNKQDYPVKVNLNFESEVYNRVRQYSYNTYFYDQKNEIYNTPTNKAITFTAYLGNQEIGKKKITLTSGEKPRNWWENANCNEDVVIDVKAPQKKQKVWVVGSIMLSQSNSEEKIKIRPTINFWYRPTDGSENWIYGRMGNGKASLMLYPDKEYELMVMYNGEKYTRNYSVKEDQTKVEMQEIDFTGIKYEDFIKNINK